MMERIRWGILGNATIARQRVIGAIQKPCKGRVDALATRSPADIANVAAKKVKQLFFIFGTLNLS
jgi:predicted dehydrogenase